MLGVPVLGWVIAFLVSALLAVFHYFRNIRAQGGWKSPWIWAAACRFVAMFLLILLFFNPWWIRVRQWVQDPVLLVYSDVSKSVSESEKQRWSEVLEGVRRTKGVKVQEYQFADKVLMGGPLQGLDVYHTNMSAVLQHANGIAANTAVAGVVWLSDGINNEGRNPQFEPVASGIPLILVGAGDPQPQIDASIESVQCNDEAFLGNTFSVEVSVKSQRLKGQPLRIQLVAGKEVREQLWSPSSEQDWKRMAFEIRPTSKGMMPISISVIGAKGDQNSINNQRAKYIKVIDERKKVALIYGAPHPDIAAMKIALEMGGQFLVESLSRSQSMEDADVFVLHGWKFQSQQELKKLSDWIVAGKAIWIFSTDGQNVSGLGKALGQSGETVSLRNWQEVQPHWNNNEAIWGLDEKESARWLGFPPVYAPVSKQWVPAGGEALLYQRWSGVNTQLPLLVYWRKESAAMAQFYGEGIWRWRMQEKSQYGDALAFDAWVRRTIGLISSAAAAKKPLEIVLSTNTWDLRDRVYARVVCRDKSGMMDDDAERQLKLVDEKGRSRSVNLARGEQGWMASLAGLNAGRYILQAQSMGGKFKTELPFAIVDQPAEILSTQANHKLLKQLADQSSGAFLPLRNGDSLSTVLARTVLAKPVMKSQSHNVHWWDLWGWMLAIVVLLGAEWSIRRYLGKY